MTRTKGDPVSTIIRCIYTAAADLERIFPGRHFTPDGHMVGSIGEVLAAKHFGLELLPASSTTHDAKTRGGRLVQIKVTQVGRIGLSSEPRTLVVLALARDGTFQVAYNGPGAPVWAAAGKMQKNRQRQIALSTVRRLDAKVSRRRRLAQS